MCYALFNQGSASSPHTAPRTNREQLGQFEYAGFWIRFFASLIDAFIFIGCVLLFFKLSGHSDLTKVLKSGVLNFVFSGLILVFWTFFSATPGKMLFSMKLVDAKTGRKPSFFQCVGRLLGYVISGLVLDLGFLWIAWDERKQGWHDKLAGTLVVKML